MIKEVFETLKINWGDIYDFVRCPRILAFKTMGVKLFVREAIKVRKEIVQMAVSKGIVGEKLVKKVLEMKKEDEKKKVTEETIKQIERKHVERVGVPLAMTLARRVERIVDNILARLGSVEYVDAIQVKSSFFQSLFKPDIVAKIGNEYYIIEVKTTKSKAREHEIQARFYASLPTFDGAIITRSGEMIEKAKCILIYPQLGKYYILNPLDITPNNIALLSSVKRIALIEGKIPQNRNVKYCDRCRWYKLCRKYERIEIETPNAPPSLEFAKETTKILNYDKLFAHVEITENGLIECFEITEAILSNMGFEIKFDVSVDDYVKILTNVERVPKGFENSIPRGSFILEFPSLRSAFSSNFSFARNYNAYPRFSEKKITSAFSKYKKINLEETRTSLLSFLH